MALKKGINSLVKITADIQSSEQVDLSKFFELGLNWSDNEHLNFFYVPNAEMIAGVFTLGLLCRDLCIESKNDRSLHFNQLLDNANDYLKKCKSCRYKCQPEIAMCGRFEQAKSQYKNISETRIYTVEEVCVFRFVRPPVPVSSGQAFRCDPASMN